MRKKKVHESILLFTLVHQPGLYNKMQKKSIMSDLVCVCVCQIQ